MGTVNLFAEKVTDHLGDYLVEYRDGLLAPINGIRILEETTKPHVKLYMDRVDGDFVIFQIQSPITKKDVDWLYELVIVQDIFRTKTRDEVRAILMEYSWNRILNRRGVDGKRGRSQALWKKVQAFRAELEIPKLAFRHYKRTARSNTTPNVHIDDNRVIIEYNTAYSRPATNAAGSPQQ